LDNKTKYRFNVNSFDITAEYYSGDIAGIFIPLSERLNEAQKRAGRRLAVYLAGPPGAGKTTMSLLLESLVCGHTGNSAQAAGIDGFHYTSEYLNNNYITQNGGKILMREVKGSAETYDFDKLYDKISCLTRGGTYWPGYDRVIHDVVENAVFIDGQIVIIEGNWLLLDEPRWRELTAFCDYSIFINAGWETLICRLVERKIMGGLNEGEAKKFVMRSDAENIKRILNNSLET